MLELGLDLYAISSFDEHYWWVAYSEIEILPLPWLVVGWQLSHEWGMSGEKRSVNQCMPRPRKTPEQIAKENERAVRRAERAMQARCLDHRK